MIKFDKLFCSFIFVNNPSNEYNHIGWNVRNKAETTILEFWCKVLEFETTRRV